MWKRIVENRRQTIAYTVVWDPAYHVRKKKYRNLYYESAVQHDTINQCVYVSAVCSPGQSNVQRVRESAAVIVRKTTHEWGKKKIIKFRLCRKIKFASPILNNSRYVNDAWCVNAVKRRTIAISLLCWYVRIFPYRRAHSRDIFNKWKWYFVTCLACLRTLQKIRKCRSTLSPRLSLYGKRKTCAPNGKTENRMKILCFSSIRSR